MEEKQALCTHEQCLRPRPLWQRILYPSIGFILIIIGLLGFVLPLIPGFPFLLIGIPLAACVHPRLELYVRRKMHNAYEAIKRKIKHSGQKQS